MAIDKSGQWWVGEQPEDLDKYLAGYSQRNYHLDKFRLARCECGSVEFSLDADDNAGVARRLCVRCTREHFICDSREFWADAEPDSWKCSECGATTANVGVGFALSPDMMDIKWIYVGVRCCNCGTVGCFAGWKVGYSPSLHLMGQA
jgi:hypothetical protein